MANQRLPVHCQPMDHPSSLVRAIAGRLLSYEAALAPAQGESPNAVARVIEKFCSVLTRFAGQSGCDSLMSRALALAKSDSTIGYGSQNGWLHSVTLEPNCVLKGLPTSIGGDDQQAISLIAHLLGLLNTFVGESMTVFLVREAWPDESFDLNTESRELS